MRVAGALLLLAVVAGPVYAADGIKAGKWEFSAQVQVPNMPKLPPGVQLPPGVNIGAGGVNVTRTQCVDSANPMPADMHERNQQHGQCKVAKMDSSGGTIRWETTCTPDDGTVVQSHGTARYLGDSMEADIKTVVVSKGGPPQETAQHVKGRFLGPCDGK